jgi:hypothetical protein
VASPYGRRRYRVKCVKVDQPEEFSDWFNSHEDARKALPRIAGRQYFMQEQNVFQAGESVEPDLAEYPLDRRCPEREHLLREWTDCSNRLMRLQSEEFAAMRTTSSVSASFAERIRVAKAADVEACRAYHQHVLEHECV